METQFRRYFDRATKVRGKTGEALLQILERRLDNVIYRLGFVPSRTMARQLVSHGHVLVNGKKTDDSSYLVTTEDVVSLSPKAIEMPVKKLLEKDQD